MPFVQREDNKIVGVFAQPQEYAVEEIAADNPELLEFVNPKPSLIDYQIAVQSFVDETAQSKRFNDGVTLASYKDSTNPVWASQATAFIGWRDQVWAYSYAQLADVEAGKRPQPAVSDFIAELPVISWPAG